MNTGSQQFGRPAWAPGSPMAWAASRRTCRDSWSSAPAARGTSGGASNWGCGFLPTVYQGVPFRSQGDPMLYLSNPPGIDDADAARFARCHQQAQRDASGRGRRSGNRDAHQLLRDGLPHANQRAGADGHFARSPRKCSRCTGPSRASPVCQQLPARAAAGRAGRPLRAALPRSLGSSRQSDERT